MTAPAPASLNVIALISGGKDSMYSLLHCLANGHKVIALANLYPAHENSGAVGLRHGSSSTNESWDRDVDSFMYQTAGHNLIPLYADVLGLPLYRQEITGGARDSSLTYSGHMEDETEALVPLLKKVKDAHPEANAVSSGAILSTYQRTRIESVAIRLGLVPLAYLWQYPSLPPPSRGGLLEDMANAGFDVRIIKVASGGLDEKLLWSNLMDPLVRKKMERAVGRFGGSVLGEGGEYETIVINGPSDIDAIKRLSDDEVISATHPINGLRSIKPFWQGRIQIAEAGMRNIMAHGSDTSTSITFKNGSGRILPLDDEAPYSECSNIVRPVVKIPELWDREFKEIQELPDQLRNGHPLYSNSNLHAATSEAKNNDTADTPVHLVSTNRPRRPNEIERDSEDLVQSRSGDHLTKPDLEASKDRENHDALTGIGLTVNAGTYQVGNIYAITNLTSCGNGSTAHEQMSGIKQRLLTMLKEINRPTSSIVFTTIILRSMSDFAAINLIYGRLVTRPNPPARVTIASVLPAGVEVMASVVINMSENVHALHVQSRSYWAAANIGPYSQAVSMPLKGKLHPSLVFVAGQIPLVPATMEILGPPPDAPSDLSHASLQWLDGFRQRCCLSLQHLWRIGKEMKVNWWTGAVAFIAGGDETYAKVTTTSAVWRESHEPQLWETCKEEDENEFDVWDMRYGGLGNLNPETKEHILPDFNKTTFCTVAHEILEEQSQPSDKKTGSFPREDFGTPKVPGFFAVEIDELPRGSDIEWQSLGIAHSEVRIVSQSISDGDCQLQVRSCMIPSTRSSISYIDIPFAPSWTQGLTKRRLSRGIDWVRNMATRDSAILFTIYAPNISLAINIRAQVVPCHTIWGPGGNQLSAGIVANFEIRDGMECQPFIPEQDSHEHDSAKL